tara:strand:+ start:2868 stop:3713 length:846 start_codon:yes stop_codon:yes gene_type:complete
MEFRKGFKIKPRQVNSDGTVVFTDGTNNVLADQITCEAYGYKFDNETGTCYSFKQTMQLEDQLQEPSNTIKGTGNKINKGTSNTIINGNFNTAKGNNNNCLISGTSNNINNGIIDATVVGGFGRAIRYGEFVVGGGANGGRNTDNVPQFSVVVMSCNTTGSGTTNMLVNGLANQYISLQNNSILGYEAFVTRLETGGSAGTVGKFSYRHIKGVVRVEDDYTLTIENFNSRILGKDGVNGTAAIAEVTTGYLGIQVSDRNNVNNSWSAVVYLHETLTNVTIE